MVNDAVGDSIVGVESHVEVAFLSHCPVESQFQVGAQIGCHVGYFVGLPGILDLKSVVDKPFIFHVGGLEPSGGGELSLLRGVFFYHGDGQCCAKSQDESPLAAVVACILDGERHLDG